MSLIIPKSNYEDPDDSFGCMNLSLEELEERSILITALLEDLKPKKENKCQQIKKN